MQSQGLLSNRNSYKRRSSHLAALTPIKLLKNDAENDENDENIVNINLKALNFQDEERSESDRSRTASNISHLLNFGVQ
jgi:hypothetical protein